MFFKKYWRNFLANSRGLLSINSSIKNKLDGLVEFKYLPFKNVYFSDCETFSLNKKTCNRKNFYYGFSSILIYYNFWLKSQFIFKSILILFYSNLIIFWFTFLFWFFYIFHFTYKIIMIIKFWFFMILTYSDTHIIFWPPTIYEFWSRRKFDN